MRSVSWAVLVLLALLPSWGTLEAPWIAEDAAILAHVDGSGALADWTGPQYGLQTVRFWRPVVSTTWWLQEALTGTAVLPLRAFNLALHLAAVLLAAGLVRRLGASTRAALLAGALVALFPEQGGTVTWLAGRTDLLVVLLVLLALHALLGRRRLLAGVLTFLACATKELAIVLPLAAVALLWARRVPADEPARDAVGARPGLPAALRAAWPVLAATVLALGARRLALGTWVGGYPIDLPGDPTALANGLAAGCVTLGRAVGPLLLGAAAIALLGGLAGTLDVRLLVAGLTIGVVGLLPLLPLASDGLLEPQNRRLLCSAELGLALAAAAGLARRSTPATRRGLVLAALAIGVLLGGRRARDAWRDTHEWAAAAEVGESLVVTARAAVATRPASEVPALIPGLPGSHGGAYCLAWGVADRFRPPFPASLRPVWPLRALFPVEGEAGLELALATDAVGRLFPDLAQPRVPALVVVAAGGGPGAGAPVVSLTLDERVFLGGEDRSARLDIALAEAGAEPGSKGILEAAVYTELGHLTARAGFVPLDGTGRELGLRAMLAFSSGVATVGQALMQAADVGARRAYLELRVLDRSGTLIAAAPWIELAWGDELLARALGR